MSYTFSRRAFLKYSAATAVAVVLFDIAFKEEANSLDTLKSLISDLHRLL